MKNNTETQGVKSEIKKSACPLCNYGCELSINEFNRGDFILRKIEYDAKSVTSQGRLCARGNMTNEILSHNLRLTYPLFNNKNITWTDALKQVAGLIKSANPDSIAITYDANNTIEDLFTIFSFAQELKINNVSASYLHPEKFLGYSAIEVKDAELKDLSNAKTVLIIGDVFNKSPVISKALLDAKYAERNNRLYYIDSVKTKIAGFANKFIFTRPDTEPIAILALLASMPKQAKDVLGDKNYNEIKKILPKLIEISNINIKDIEEIAQVLTSNAPTLIVQAIDYGKTQDPLLLSLTGQLLAGASASKKYCAPALWSAPHAKINFGSVVEQINSGKIKTLFNFGDNFPSYYPQLSETLNKLDNMVHTAIFRNSYASRLSATNYSLAVPSLLEKKGTVNTLWSRQNLKPLADAISGSKPISEIIDSILPNANSKSKPRLSYKNNLKIDDIINRAVGTVNTYKAPAEMVVLGEETAFGYLGIFENKSQILKINANDAKRLHLNNDDKVILNANNQEKELSVKISNSLGNNTMSVSVNTPDNRNLFPIKIDDLTKEIIISSTHGRIKTQ